MRCPLVVASIVALVATINVECFSEGDQNSTVRPRLAECTMKVGDRTLKPIRAVEDWRYQHLAGTLTIAVDGRTVTATDAKTGKTVWQIESPDEWRLQWLAADDKIAYFRAVKFDEKTQTPHYEPRAHVRRLQLGDHRWLEPLTITEKKPQDKIVEFVVALLPLDKSQIVLAKTLVDAPGSPEDGRAVNYRVTRFDDGKARPVWSVTDQCATSRSAPGAYLMASRRPDYAVDRIQSLSLIGTRVIVCPGPLDDLVCFELKNGYVAWRVGRLGLYRRGFIGPSMWTHTIERGPDDGQHENAIVAGPLVVPAKKGIRNEDSYSVFVAVARSEKSRWAGYLADCVVYEIAEEGNPIGIVNLPRMVNGALGHADSRGIVWGCSSGAFVRLVTRENRHDYGMMLGGSDKLCRVAWYCQPGRAVSSNAWLTADAAGDPVAFSRSSAFRPAGDPYVLKAGDSVYHFPIRKLDLESGQGEPMLLDVPFDGSMNLPTRNFSRTQESTHAIGPYLLGLTWLDVRGDVLEVVLGAESHSYAVHFPLAEIEAPAAKR